MPVRCCGNNSHAANKQFISSVLRAEEIHGVIPSEFLTKSSIKLLVIAVGGHSVLHLFNDIGICHVSLCSCCQKGLQKDKGEACVSQERSEEAFALPNKVLNNDFTAGLTLDMTLSRPRSCSQSCLQVTTNTDSWPFPLELGAASEK